MRTGVRSHYDDKFHEWLQNMDDVAEARRALETLTEDQYRLVRGAFNQGTVIGELRAYERIDARKGVQS